MTKKDNKMTWNIVIAVQVIIYVALTIAIFVVQRKITIIEQAQAQSAKKQEREKVTKTPNITEINQEKEQALKKAISEGKDQEQNREKLAKHYYQRGKTTQSIAQYQKMLQQKPNDPELHLALGRLYMTQKETKSKAKEHFEKALELSPEHPKKRIIEIWLKGE